MFPPPPHPPKKHGVDKFDFQVTVHRNKFLYRRSDKSLARPGRKQARKRVTDERDFEQHRDASCHQIPLPLAKQDAKGNASQSDRNISLFPSWSG